MATNRAERPTSTNPTLGVPQPDDAATTRTPDFEADEARLGGVALGTDWNRFQGPVEIGHGGMGTVYAAYDPVLERNVALKTVDANHFADPAKSALFLHEACVTAQLDHPNIVPVYDLGFDADRRLFFAMKLINGRTFSHVLDKLHASPYDPIEFERALRVFMKVCDAVSFAHSRGIVHRDLKPDNIMVGSHGQVYVMDWGTALALESAAHRPRDSAAPEARGAVVGTLVYMSPEQALGLTEAIDERTDVFGLGAILYHLLTGAAPYALVDLATRVQAAQTGAIPPLEAHRAWPDLPPGMCRITLRALGARAADRYATVDALRDAIEEFLRDGGWFETLTFAAGDVVLNEGERGTAAYIVKSGRAEVFRGASDRPEIVRTIGPGDVFGELSVLTRAPRSASVRATEALRVLVVTRKALERELGHRTTWMRPLFESLARRFLELDEKVRDQGVEPR